MNIGLVHKKILGDSVNILDSQHVTHVRGGVTIDATLVTTTDEYGRKYLKEGTVLGKVTTTGLFGPYDNDNTDGTETAKCVLATFVSFQDWEGNVSNQAVSAIDHGRLIEARCTGVDAAAKTELKGILFV